MNGNEILKELIEKRNDLEGALSAIVDKVIAEIEKTPWNKRRFLPEEWYTLDNEHQEVCDKIDNFYSMNEDLVMYTVFLVEEEKRCSSLKAFIEKMTPYIDKDWVFSYKNALKRSEDICSHYRKIISEIKMKGCIK